MRQPPVDEFQSLCTMVGYVVILWGLAEHSLDGGVAALFHDYGGKTLEKDPQLPRSLKQKLTFIKKCLALEPMAAFREEGLEIVDRFGTLSKKRHDIVHSAITNLEPIDGVFDFSKIDYTKQMHLMRNVKLSASDFPGLTKDLGDLGRDTTRFVQKLLAPLL